jgi:hypothetical protein
VFSADKYTSIMLGIVRKTQIGFHLRRLNPTGRYVLTRSDERRTPIFGTAMAAALRVCAAAAP